MRLFINRCLPCACVYVRVRVRIRGDTPITEITHVTTHARTNRQKHTEAHITSLSGTGPGVYRLLTV